MMNSNEMTFTQEDYIKAFRAIEQRLTEGHRAILAAHYATTNRTATSGQLAALMGYQTRQPLNKSLLSITEMLCDALGVRFADPFLVIASVSQAPGNEPQLTMRPAVAQALEALGWCGSPFEKGKRVGSQRRGQKSRK